MKLFYIVAIAASISACSSNQPFVPKQETSPQSNMVFYPAYKYQGVEVEPSHNWFMGQQGGLKSNPKLRFIAEEGSYFDHAEQLTAKEMKAGTHSKSVSVAHAQQHAVESTDASFCGKQPKEQGDLLGEWIVHFNTAQSVPLDMNAIITDIGAVEPKSVIITGHTDDRGSDTYNLALSKRRAEAVATEVKQIWGNAEYTVVWSGECPRLTPNVDSISRSKNRRVHIKAFGDKA